MYTVLLGNIAHLVMLMSVAAAVLSPPSPLASKPAAIDSEPVCHPSTTGQGQGL